MDVKIDPGPLSGSVQAISSKSYLHRELICAAFADKPTAVTVSYDAEHDMPEDIQATIGCLHSLGTRFEIAGRSIRVIPASCETGNAVPELDCGESGSTFRFLLPVAAAVSEKALFLGRGRLPERPVAELAGALKKHGISFSAEKIPFTISGKLTGGAYEIPGNISSQYLTGLLLMLPLLDEDAEIRLTTDLVSAGYIDITTQVMSIFSVQVSRSGNIWKIEKRNGKGYTAPSPHFGSHTDPYIKVPTVNIVTPGDWSNTAAFLTASMLRKENGILCRSLGRDSRQGDQKILSFLEAFGAVISEDEYGICPEHADLHGTVIDIDSTPDLLPVLSITACAAKGDTIFGNAARLRLKESDRIESTAAMIRALGGSVETEADKLVIHGTGRLSGGTVDAANDHRIVMAASIAASICDAPVIIRGAEAVNKSYPTFFEDLKSVKGDVHVL